MVIRSTCFLSAICILFLALTQSAMSQVGDTITVNKFDFAYGKGGMTLKYKGVTFIRRSSLYCVSPGWTSLLFGHHLEEQHISSEDIPGGKIVKVAMQNETFAAEYRVTMLESDEVIIDLGYRLLRDVPAEIEYCVGYIPASLIVGLPYEADTVEGRKSGVTPYFAKSADHFEAMLVPPFKRLSFKSRLADIEMTVSGDQPNLIIFDARRDPQAWAREAPVFWCGMGVPPEQVKFGKEYHVVTTIKFTDRAGIPAKPEIAPETVNIKMVRDAKLPTEHLPNIIPEPKSVQFDEQDFVIKGNAAIVLPDGPTADDWLNADILNEELRDIYGIEIPVTTASKMKPGTKVIAIGEAGRNSVLDYLCSKVGIQAPPHDEGYALKACPEFVAILGKDTRGTFYGVQTLLQLLKPTVDGASVRGALVNDWPTMRIRGAHVFIGNEAKPFLEKMIRRIFARHKMNYLIIEADYTKWETHPEIWLPWSTSKQDLKEIIDYARLHHMEVVPLVQSLGHSEWMFANGSNLDIAEDPEHPYGYCPSKPESYKFIFEIYSEALELFRPRVFHIGHDEVTMRGRFPHDEVCSKHTVSELFLKDVKTLYDWFKARGVRTMMWGDMMLYKTETPDAGWAESLEAAQERRRELPSDIIIADWHYCAAPDFPSVRLFKEKGHEVLACTWYNPKNIADFARSAKKDGADGLIQTLWSGYNISEKCLKDQFQQYHAYIVAAEYAWNDSRLAVEELPYTPADEFMALWKRERAEHSSRNGFVVDLSPFANVAMSAEDTNAWVGYGPEHDLRSFKTGTVRLRGVEFEVPVNKALMLWGAMNPDGNWPSGIRIPLDRTAEGLAFLMATGWSTEKGENVGRIEIRWSDTESMVLDLVYGENVAAWNDPIPTPSAPTAWVGKTQAGERVTLRMINWQNPYPERPIRSVEITSSGTEACPVVFGITGFVQ